MISLTSRRFAVVLTCAAVALSSSCMAGTGEDSDSPAGQRLAVAQTWVPSSDMSIYTDDANALTQGGVAETLVVTDENVEVVAGLAESFEVSDERTVVFTLREDATFHDGTKVDAAAVRNCIDHALKASPRPASLEGLDLQVEATDEHTVTITSAQPDPLLVNRFAIPSTLILAPSAFEDDPARPSVVGTGTGPFELTEQPTTSGFSADAFTDYWAGDPVASGVDVQFISDPAARAAGLKAGELDIVSDLPVAELGGLPEDQVVEVRGVRVVGAFLNVKGALSDPALRAAGAAALDPEEVVKGAFEGHADAAEFTLEGARWDSGRPQVQRPEPAQVSGQALTVATYNDRPELPGTVSLVAEQLREAGFTVEAPVVKSYTVMEEDILGGTYDVVVSNHGMAGTTVDPVSGLVKTFGCESTWDPAQLCNHDVEAALKAAMAAPIGDERDRLTLQAEALGLGQVSYVPLAHQPLYFGIAPGVKGLARDGLWYRVITHETTTG